MVANIKEKNIILIDAGVENIKIAHIGTENSQERQVLIIKNNDEVLKLFQENGIIEELKKEENELFVSGKLAKIIVEKVGRGREISGAAAIWHEAKKLAKKNTEAVGIIDLSASGYMIVAVNAQGELLEDALITNPRCGAGSGTNLARVLAKLDIKREAVDEVLLEYLGEAGETERKKVNVRADRCGVFSSSATISDKNQGIPLPFALATTLKSEVMKACRKMPIGLNRVYLAGGVFAWQFARECAADYFKENGAKLEYIKNNDLLIRGMTGLIEELGLDNFRPLVEEKLSRGEKMLEYEPFLKIRKELESKDAYVRCLSEGVELPLDIRNLHLDIGLDIGSTMAKVAIAESGNGRLVYLASYDNHGDTIETVKEIFRNLDKAGLNGLMIQGIGITGSGRYQVQKVLREVYPEMADNISVLVENYAHARGSIRFAKERIALLKAKGITVNEDFFTLVDVGGEDTKISIVSIKDNDLYDNAMNIKCSAGTGSLMDTLRSMFGIADVRQAAEKAMQADKAYAINATCAVFLMENARKLQSAGYEQGEILASCYWAIVENMARTLWPQIDFPKNTIVLLHGQTMLSDPLPLATMERLKDYSGTDVFGIVPPYPGHRACLGLMEGMKKEKQIEKRFELRAFIEQTFEKRIFICRGASCGDSQAACARSMLLYNDKEGKQRFISLGGCTSVNEMEAKRESGSKNNNRQDLYQRLWKLIDAAQPKSEADDRLVIPRSFAVSEQSYLLAQFYSQLGLPVHVDSVRADDVILAQPRFDIDTCAPVIGASGQFIRLAGEKHGLIAVPQIDFLHTGGKSLGRTCTTNQGGVIIAYEEAREAHPEARFALFDLSFANMDDSALALHLKEKSGAIWERYGIYPSDEEAEQAIRVAKQKGDELRAQIALETAAAIDIARERNYPVLVAAGREYILNPGVYDSHVGRLFGDKGVVVIPAWALELELDEEFKDIYWRNPHLILSLVRAVKDKKLNKVIKHEELAKAIEKLESRPDFHFGLVIVSTFRCGPDSMILPMIQEVAKEMPFLVIQSDAAINELAHLENRANTYLNQLSLTKRAEGVAGFHFETLDAFASGEIDREKDVLYFPTLEDNRFLPAVLRSAGYTCFDNFNESDYDLKQLVSLGRKYSGDTVCAPFAAVLADTFLALKDFVERKARGELSGRNRVLVFNNKGTGPCRQGQYFNAHRVFLEREIRTYAERICAEKGVAAEAIDIRYIVGLEENNYNIGLKDWTLLLAFESAILQGVLHNLYFKSAATLSTHDEFMEYRKDFSVLKKDLIDLIEHSGSSGLWRGVSEERRGFVKLIALLVILGQQSYKLRSRLKKFRQKWSRQEKPGLRVYAEGEAYMRVAMAPATFEAIYDILGVANFSFSYSPLWLYFEYLLENKKINTDEKEQDGRRKKRRQTDMLVFLLRQFLAQPLYQAAGVKMPKKMSQVLEKARAVLPRLKPYGELAPYVGEGIEKLDEGYDLFLNIAPEGCMVASMGEMLSASIKRAASEAKPEARIQGVFSSDGELDVERLELAILKVLGPEAYYRGR
jgi:activator of 2-hydroxyglutaryl-CoA dehydratase/predicted nucleotide-binding protein (sugar kinase/HSP70/actin superfamily)